MTATTSVGPRAENDERKFMWLVRQMRHQLPQLGAKTIARELCVHDLACLASKVPRKAVIPRRSVVVLGLGSLETDTEGALKLRARHERRVNLLIQLGRNPQRGRTQAIKERWRELGLSYRQERVVQCMPCLLHHRPAWVTHLFQEVRRAPWLKVSVEPMYHDGRQVKLVVIEAGTSVDEVDVEVEVGVDMPPTDAMIPGRNAAILGVSVFVPAKHELHWNPLRGGPAILAEARSIQDLRALTAT